MMVYIVLTAGIWMFLFAYTNSYNRLTEDKIVPASIVVMADRAEISVLEHSFEISLDVISPDNKLYLVAYLLSPDELREELLILPLLPYAESSVSFEFHHRSS